LNDAGVSTVAFANNEMLIIYVSEPELGLRVAYYDLEPIDN
jgi:hypothetical protein